MNIYHSADKNIWTYAPERQLFEMLFEYCNNNNLDVNNSILDGIYATIKRQYYFQNNKYSKHNTYNVK